RLCRSPGHAAISGSAQLGNGVIMGGGAGTTHGIYICNGARFALTSIATKDITEPGDYADMPARLHIEHTRALAASRRVDESLTRLRTLEKRLASLESLRLSTK